MHVTLDHLAAVIITSVILLVYALVQVRGTQTASETTVNQIVYSEALSITDLLSVDIENMLTPTQSTATLGGYTCQVALDASGNTVSFSFPTLDPDSTNLDPSSWDAIQVRYDLNLTGDSVRVFENQAIVSKNLYTLDRSVITASATIDTGGSMGYITDFSIQIGSRGSPTFLTNGVCPAASMTRVRYSYKMATRGVDFITTDQLSTNNLNTSRFGSTVVLSNYAN